MNELSGILKEAAPDPESSFGTEMAGLPFRCRRTREENGAGAHALQPVRGGGDLEEILRGEPCISVADRRVLCGELFRTPGGADAMIFVRFASIDGALVSVDTCVMAVEALAEAIDAGRIVVVAGEEF
jgi:hypothetical protein